MLSKDWVESSYFPTRSWLKGKLAKGKNKKNIKKPVSVPSLVAPREKPGPIKVEIKLTNNRI